MGYGYTHLADRITSLEYDNDAVLTELAAI